MENKKGFTLVELIVVISILSILSTIGMIAYSGYLSGVRDVNRTSQLESLGDALKLYSLKNQLPLPTNNIEILHSGSVVAYQGVLGPNIIEAIGYSDKGVDPKDETPFHYYITENRRYFQLMTFLEEEVQLAGLYNNTFAAINYNLKFPYVEGAKLGILVGDINSLNKNKPLDESIDLKYTTTSYTAILSNKYMLTGTGLILQGLVDVISAGGRGYTVSSTGELIFTDLDNL